MWLSHQVNISLFQEEIGLGLQQGQEDRVRVEGSDLPGQALSGRVLPSPGT
jgi:hypothetical protein